MQVNKAAKNLKQYLYEVEQQGIQGIPYVLVGYGCHRLLSVESYTGTETSTNPHFPPANCPW
jgi:hypothetical protein